METLAVVLYFVAAVFFAGLVSHFVVNTDSIFCDALGVLVCVFSAVIWPLTTVLIIALVVVSVLVGIGRDFGRWIDSKTLQLFVVFLVVLLCIAVPQSSAHAETPTYRVDYCITNIGWQDTDGSYVSGGMCEEAKYYNETFGWNVVAISPNGPGLNVWLTIPEGSTPHQVAEEWISNDVERRWLTHQ